MGILFRSLGRSPNFSKHAKVHHVWNVDSRRMRFSSVVVPSFPRRQETSSSADIYTVAVILYFLIYRKSP
jgi:hypothetical protein